MEPDFIGVIGGRGRMGALMARLFTEAGYEVLIADLKDGPVPPDWAAQCRVLLLAVPIPVLPGLLERLGPYTRRDGVVIDIASVKQEPVEAMLKHCRGEVIGGHPLFGPGVKSLDGQLFFVCPARSKRWLGWWLDLLERFGIRAVEIEPRRHDWLMAHVQVLRHLLLFSFGLSLARLNFDAFGLATLSGPWFNQLVQLLTRQLGQGPDLFADLAGHNSAAAEVAAGFLAAAQEVASAYTENDRQAIIELIGEIADHLPPAGQPHPPPGGRETRPDATGQARALALRAGG